MLACVINFQGLVGVRSVVLGAALVMGACSTKSTPTAAASDSSAQVDGVGAGSADSGAKADAAPKACVHPTPPQDPCQERWCDNPIGVGMPCTAKGGECKANEKKATEDQSVPAVICTAAFASEAFCTVPCVLDDQCGAAAVCRGDPKDPDGPRGCILATCSGDSPSPAADAVGDGDATADSAGADAVDAAKAEAISSDASSTAGK